MSEIKYGQLWARHSELVTPDTVGKYRISFEGLKNAVGEVLRSAQPGAVWVKATTRLPGIRAEVKWRIDGGEWEAKETPLGMWYNKPNDFHKYEWLDESGTAAGRGEDAVAFAKWATLNHWRWVEGLRVWKNPMQDIDQMTTAELYAIFKQQKEK